MAAAITLASNTAEGQLFELLEQIINLQNTQNENATTPIENINGTSDIAARQNTYTVIIDYETTINNSGQIIQSAKVWLQ